MGFVRGNRMGINPTPTLDWRGTMPPLQQHRVAHNLNTTQTNREIRAIRAETMPWRNLRGLCGLARSYLWLFSATESPEGA